MGGIWWGDMVGGYVGEIWWGDMVGGYGGGIWWGDMVGRYGGEIARNPFFKWENTGLKS